MAKYDFSKLTGEVITIESEGYHDHRIAWNRAIDKSPSVIVYCYENEDVINAINFAKENSLGIRIRSGGHHYEGYSTGDGAMVIDVSKMNKIVIDEEKNQVKIQGGVRNRELYDATGKLGYPFPGGGCPTVGVPGLVLGGGWGYSARYLGLASDSLIELEMINYNGEIVKANKNENSDLFWACRGAGGGNFGVIVSMTFNLPEKFEMGTLITLEYPNISLEDNIKILTLCQKEFKTIDKRINMKIVTYNSKDKGRGVKIIGVFYGDNKECNEILAQFKTIINNYNLTLDYKSIREINIIIQDAHPDYESYKSTGRFVFKDYTHEELKRIISMVNERPEGSIYAAVSLYGLGGAVNDNKNEGAFFYRDANFIMGLQSVWEDEKYASENRQWVIKQFNVMKELTTGSFVNFPFAELKDYEENYYGDNVEKLRLVKRQYDPQGVFNFEQGLKA